MDSRKWTQVIHVAKSRVGLDEDNYRLLLRSAAGVDSAKDIVTLKQYLAVMRAFDKLGFNKGRKVYKIDDAQMAKAYALWGELYKASAVHDKSYGALLAWIKRMYNNQDILTKAQKVQAIEALKGWLDRLENKEVLRGD